MQKIKFNEKRFKKFMDETAEFIYSNIDISFSKLTHLGPTSQENFRQVCIINAELSGTCRAYRLAMKLEYLQNIVKTNQHIDFIKYISLQQLQALSKEFLGKTPSKRYLVEILKDSPKNEDKEKIFHFVQDFMSQLTSEDTQLIKKYVNIIDSYDKRLSAYMKSKREVMKQYHEKPTTKKRKQKN